ncbi:MAG: FxsA family protein [Sulfitobacter sp.]
MWLLIAFIAIPMIEIALFIKVGGIIGLGWTLAIVLITAVAGTWLVRTQGALAMGQLRSSFSDMQDPTEPLVHGAMILFAGALLLTPGFFTDAVGFSLLIPAVRKAAFQAIRARVNVQSFGTPGTGQHQHQGRSDSHGDVIDAEFHEIRERSPDDKGDSGWTKH